jgi:hypothetical protein
MSFPAFATLGPGMEKQTSTRQGGELGQEAYMFPGRWFVYGIAGEAATVAKLQTTRTNVANNDLDLALSAAAAAGARTVSLTLGSTAIVKDEYRAGFFFVNDAGTEQGHQYLIKSHPAAASGANVVLTLDEPDGLATALTTSEQCGIIVSTGFDFVVNPTTFTDAPLGAACVDIADNSYAWLQKRGPGMGTADATAPAGGLPIAASDGTAGAFEVDLEDGTVELPHIGTQRDTASANTEAAPVVWQIA